MAKKSGKRIKKKRSRPLKMAQKRRRLPVPVWAVACTLILLAGGLALWVWGRTPNITPVETVVEEEQWRAKPGDLVAFADSVAVQASEILKGLGVPEGVITRKRLPEHRGSAMRWEVISEIPGELPLVLCNLELTRLVRRMGGDVLEAREDRLGTRLSMLVGLDGKRSNLITLQHNPNLARMAGRIAIIVDDFGYQDEELIKGFCALKQTLTLSIFPGFEKTAWIAEHAARSGHGVMVHMPMEPLDYPYRDPGPDAVFADYSEEKIQTLVRQALAAVPHAKGLNNHMGSRVTEDRYAMTSVLKEVYRYGFFFVDSVTSPRSIAYGLAREMGLPTGHNMLFLDQKETRASVEQALETLAKKARRQGTVIGIGHAKSPTLAAFQHMLPELEKRGIAFIKAEDAVK